MALDPPSGQLGDPSVIIDLASPTDLPSIDPLMNVDEASHLVVDFLTDHVGPYGWTVSRSADDGRVHLRARDDAVTTDAESRAKALRPHGPLLDLLGSMLSTVLSCDLARLEEARLRGRAEMAADTDVLTGLLNRRGWARALQAEEGRYRRLGDPAVVILVDLDHLKEVNDGLGHVAGDVVIQSAAQVIEDCTRPYDYVARLGGDEFAVLAVDVTESQAQDMVDRMRVALAQVDVAASVGHAPYTPEGGFTAAVTAADRSMYAEKRRRRATHG